MKFLIFILYLTSFVCFSNDCYSYLNYKKKINKSTPEEKLILLSSFFRENDLQCMSMYNDDVLSLRQKIFSYYQMDGNEVQPGGVFECSAIVEGYFCDSIEEDLSIKGHFRTERELRRRFFLTDVFLKFPLAVSGYVLNNIYYSWQSNSLKNDGVYIIRAVNLTLDINALGNYAFINKAGIDEIINVSADVLDDSSFDFYNSTKWISAIYKSEEGFIKVVWYY